MATYKIKRETVCLMMEQYIVHREILQKVKSESGQALDLTT